MALPQPLHIFRKDLTHLWPETLFVLVLFAAFLHQGKLLFSEEMTSLTARFREITITLPPPAPGELPATLIKSGVPPDSWLLLEQTPTAARFVHIHADTEPVAAQIAAVFSASAPNIQSIPMTLRGIFLALAKSGRTPAAPTEGKSL